MASLEKHFSHALFRALIEFPVLSLVQLHYAMSLSKQSEQRRDSGSDSSTGA